MCFNHLEVNFNIIKRDIEILMVLIGGGKNIIQISTNNLF